MRICRLTALYAILATASQAAALEPNEILIIANSQVPASMSIARYYCQRRKVPADSILALPLGAGMSEGISRDDYEKNLAGPIRDKLFSLPITNNIKCLLTTYGVPIKVGGRGPLKDQEEKLRQLQESADQQKKEIEELEEGDGGKSSIHRSRLKDRLKQLQSDIDRISGKETDASVDSELSMVLAGDYELYRWQPNKLRNSLPGFGLDTLMVCRLDGPNDTIVKALVDKALSAENNGLKGTAYIDSRGIATNKEYYSPGYYDQSLRDLAVLVQFRANLDVKQERTENLFAPGACPHTALYCGWYSLQKYVDAFDFVDGAIGYHISSLGAADLRDPNSTEWCPAMLTDGVTATLGAVAEPYLHAFPEPRAFFLELFSGRCLVEAYYHSKPFNSWRLVLIGDPLYRPFKTSR